MPYPLFNATQYVSSASGPESGVASAAIPCNPGDVFFFVGTMRCVSGLGSPAFLMLFYAQNGDGLPPQVLLQPPDNGWHIAAAVAPAAGAYAYLVAYPTESFGGNTVWEISSYQLSQNGAPLNVQLGFGLGPTSDSGSAIVSYSLTQEFVFPLYYLSLFTSQYKLAPNLYTFAATLIQPTTDLLACVQSLYQAFDLSTAIGLQLDIIGTIVGASRQLPFQPFAPDVLQVSNTSVSSNRVTVVLVGTPPLPLAVSQRYTMSNFTHVTALNGQTLTVASFNYSPIGGGVWSFTALFTHAPYGPTPDVGAEATLVGGGIPLNPMLSDNDYRTLLQAKVAQNQWDGQVGSLYTLWNTLFPGGRIIVIDNQDMTADIILAGAFSAIAYQMIVNDMIVPRPQGVLYTYLTPTLPVLGYDQDNANIAGYDTGHYA
jgi:hypothetical protein